MGFAGEGRQRLGDLLQACPGVDRGGALGAPACAVSGVGSDDGVAEVAFHPGQGRVPKPVCGDLLGGDPGQVLAQADQR